MLTTVIIVIRTSDLSKGVLAGVILSALFFVAKISKIHVFEGKEKDNIIFEIEGQLFFASIQGFIEAFDFTIKNTNIIIDFTNTHVWDDSAVGAIDKVVIKYSENNNKVTIKGLNSASKILVDRLAVDGSENSLRATDEATKIASLSSKCVIEVVVVVDFSQSKNEVIHSHGKEELELKRRKKLLPIEEKLKSNKVSYQIKVLHGEPGQTIVDYANKEKFELVFVGSRGLNSLQEMVLGSVSHKILKRVLCPVLVVK